MKKIFNIFTALLLLSLVGCTKDVDLELDGNTTTEIGEKISVTLNLSTTDTRININGTSITWSDYEEIWIFPVVDGEYMLNCYYFSIDSESISPDGKSASFTGDIYDYASIEPYSKHTIEYIAVAGISDIWMDNWGDYYNGDEDCFGYYRNINVDFSSWSSSCIYPQVEGEEASVKNILMVSDYFTISEEDIIEDYGDSNYYSKSNINFTSQSAVIALNIYLDNAADSYTFINSLTFSNYGDYTVSEYPFSNSVSLSAKSTGLELETTDTRSTFEFTNIENWCQLSSSDPVIFYMPVVWNTAIETIDPDMFSDYHVSFKSYNNQYSPTESISATKVLEGGYLYSCDVRFDATEFVDGAPDQTEALLAFYELIGGGEKNDWEYPDYENMGSWSDEEWDAFYTWIDSALTFDNWNEWTDISSWEGISTDEYGYVTSIGISYKDINCALTDEAIEALAPLTKLYSFTFISCGVTGELPVALAESSTIKYINLSDNNITGNVPASYGTFMANGGSLYISGNRLSGELPSTITDDAAVWSTFARVSLSQQSGYGFENTPAVYLSESILTSSDGTTMSTTDIFAEHDLTLVCYAYDYYTWYSEIFSTLSTLCSNYSKLGSLLIYDSNSTSSIAENIPGYIYKLEGEIESGDSTGGNTVGTKATTVSDDSVDVSVDSGGSSYDSFYSSYYSNSLNFSLSYPYSFIIVGSDGEILYTQGDNDSASSEAEEIETFVNGYFTAGDTIN